LKARLNPGPGRFGGFDPGDRVAHSPAPGRTTVGTVVSADGSEVVLDLRERRVVVLVAGLPAATLDPGDPVRARGPLVG
jgi:hypothetical protein